MNNVILICGQAGSGKNTLADILKKHIDLEPNGVVIDKTLIRNNAQSVKDIATNKYNWNGEKDAQGRQLLLDITEQGYAQDKFYWEDMTFTEAIMHREFINKQCEYLIIPDWRYESTLEYFRDIVDVYLVDFKYMNSSLAKEYSFAENYADVAKKALDKMVLYRNTLCFDEDFMLKSGVIVRHLCLPGCVQDSKDVIKYVYEKYADKIRLSIMNQYTPMPECKNHKLLCRKLTEKEYEEIIDYCIDIGIEDAYIQEGETASESFIPEFM